MFHVAGYVFETTASGWNNQLWYLSMCLCLCDTVNTKKSRTFLLRHTRWHFCGKAIGIGQIYTYRKVDKKKKTEGMLWFLFALSPQSGNSQGGRREKAQDRYVARNEDDMKRVMEINFCGYDTSLNKKAFHQRWIDPLSHGMFTQHDIRVITYQISPCTFLQDQGHYEVMLSHTGDRLNVQMRSIKVTMVLITP